MRSRTFNDIFFPSVLYERLLKSYKTDKDAKLVYPVY
jgi:hypothetical protein